MEFKQIFGKDPYPHQEETFKALEKGSSVILRAPTGSGKSEAVFIPFVKLRGSSLAGRMIYALPMRSLVNSLADRFKDICKKNCLDLEVKIQHGQRQESLFFDSQCIVATLDQIISAYACAPLSLPVRFGNIPAGAVTSSFIIFDEIHTFAPQLGLQCCLLIAERLSQLGLPFVIMSATLPTEFMFSIANRLRAQVIEAKEGDIPIRSQRKVTLHLKLNEELSPSQVINLFEESQGRLIVVCNTVERATKIYQNIKDKIEPKPILLHSRFFDKEREEKERKINELFKQNCGQKAILIATQVIEVGMDISCDLMLSELSPVDSLIQRAGRCARWGGEGKIFIFGIPHHAPYDRSIINSTIKAIVKRNGEKLTWPIEKEMVDEVLGNFFKKYSQNQAGSKVIMLLSQAAFEGKPFLAEKAVREEMFIEVSIHNNPAQLRNKIFMLPKCRLRPYVMKKYFEDQKPPIWKVEVDRAYENDYSLRIELIRVKSSQDIIANNFYIISSDFAACDPELGLTLGQKGTPLDVDAAEGNKLEPQFDEIPNETWEDHSRRTIDAFEKYIFPQEEYTFNKLLSWLGRNQQEIRDLLRLILALHDLGKLTEEWQKTAGATSIFLAHSGKRDKANFPIHATISAYVIGDYLKNKWGPILGDSAYYALAHHHSVRATKIPRYKLQDGWFEEINKVLDRYVGIKFSYNDVKAFERQLSSTSLSSPIPAFEKEKRYTTYILFSRWLRLADRKALEIARSEMVGENKNIWFKLC